MWRGGYGQTILWEMTNQMMLNLIFLLIVVECGRLLCISDKIQKDSPFQTNYPSKSMESTSIVIYAKDMWSENSSTSYQQGNNLLITVPGDQTWTDWYIVTSAEGYTNYFSASLRFNDPENTNIFSLICCMNQDISTCSYIGCANNYLVPVDGYLTCFANDVSFMYWNNKGSLTLTVEVVS